MKEFNLEEYLKNPKKVVTRNGKNVRIICTDRESTYFPIIALVKKECIEENAAYTKDGKYYLDDTNDNDLFFAPEKHEGWVNVFCVRGANDINDNRHIGDTVIYKSKEDAEKKGKCFSNYVTSAKIEWEE